MKAIVDKNIPFLRGVLDPYFRVEYYPGADISAAVVRDADALIIRTRTNCNSSLLTNSRVRFIGSATIGFDHIDTDFCIRNGITWANAPGCNSSAVQQWVATAILHWSATFSKSLNGLTIGVVGVGNVGRKVVALAQALGMNVICCDPPRKRGEGLPNFVDFATVLQNSDIITFHVPLNRGGVDSTLHMLNPESLALCKPNVFILNSSRGEVVDSNALLSFLERNPDAQAALDVWENEPNVPVGLLHRTIVATPHIAGYSLEGKVMGTKMIIDSLSRFFKLGIDPWIPNPNPLSAIVRVDDASSIEQIIKSTYQILNDDFRNRIEDFEALRNNYNYRRDFSGYCVSKDAAVSDVLKNIGFSINLE